MLHTTDSAWMQRAGSGHAVSASTGLCYRGFCQAFVPTHVRMYGCAWQDVAEALRRLPPDVVIARNCRLRRALDLSLKHESLPKELLAKQTPELSYLGVRICLPHTKGGPQYWCT
jgi:hypothetical protein